MKSSLFALLVLTLSLCLSCGPDGKHARLKGTIVGVESADIEVFASPFNTQSKALPLDTLHLKKGSFKVDLPTETAQIITLLYPNFSATTMIIEPGQTIELHGDANRLKEISVTGSEENELLTEFRLSVAQKKEKDSRMHAATFVRSHPTTLAAIAVFAQYFLAQEQRNLHPTQELLALLVRSQPQQPLVKMLQAQLQAQLATAVGQSLPNFSVKTLDGKTVSNAQLAGKAGIIVHQANWSGQHYLWQEAIRTAQEKHGSSFCALALSYDESAEVARQNGLQLPNVFTVFLRDGLDDPLAQRFGMRYIPGCLLFNKQGKIVARDVPVDKLPQQLDALF